MAKASGRERASRRVLPAHQWAMMIAFLGVLTLALLGPMMTYSELPMAGEGSPVRQAAYLLALAFAIYGARPVADPKRLLVVPVAIIVALAWCWLSLTWAVEPGIAVRRLILTSAIIWTLFLSISQLGYVRSLGVLRVVLVIALLANFIAVIAFPDFGIHQLNEPGDKDLVGDWRGILMHKNFAGAVSAITVLAFAFDARRIPMAVRGAVILAAALFLFFTVSKTSYGMVGVALVIGYLFQSYNARYRVPVLVALCVVGLGAAIAFGLFRNPLALEFQDADAFTGRTQIWQALVAYIHDRGWLGAGYGSFWNIGPTSPIYHYAHNWVILAASGHNGFMDLLVTIGLPGVILAVIAAFFVPFGKLLGDAQIPARRGALLIALLIFCIGHNTTESSLFDRDTIVEVILMITIALIGVARSGSFADRDSLVPFSRAGLRPGIA